MMQTIDYTKFSDTSRAILRRACNLAVDSHYDEIATSILLIAMVQEAKEMVRFVLDKLNVSYTDFCTRLSERLQYISRYNTSTPEYSSDAMSVIRYVISDRRENNATIHPEILFLAIANKSIELAPLFQQFNITTNRLTEAVDTYANGNRVSRNSEEECLHLDNLEKYAQNLRKEAEDGRLEPTIGRDEEIRRILQIISRKTKNNPILIGEPGTGKTAIIEGLAIRLNRGDVPDDMKQLQIYSLDVATLVAGASRQGEFEERLKSVISDLKKAPWIILFIDEIHLLLGAGRNGGAMDAANILKPELARNGLKVIGATTFDEYNKFLESDQAFARRFQRIGIDEPSEAASISILRGIKSRYEAHHKIKIMDDAIVAAVKLSTKYINDRFLPDKAIDVLDETASRMRIDRSSVPAELDRLTRLVRQKEIEKESLIQDGNNSSRIEPLTQEISQLREQENILNAKWINERRQFDRLQEGENEIEQLQIERENAESLGRYNEAARYNREIEIKKERQAALTQELSELESPLLKLALDAEDIKETITKSTGIPISSVTTDELDRLSRMPQSLRESVKGQDQAIASVSNVIKRSRLGLGNESSPVGSFLFMGTTGVGKTELAKALAEYLFGSRDMLIRIDMSEYQQEYSVSRLFGAPPGYVGYDQGGQLTEAVRRKPYSVILLDEIEKSHPKVCETLLQVLDDGRMTDGKGRSVNFKNTVIIMTSNLGAEVIYDSACAQSESVKDELIQELKSRTSPEFVNRIDDIIVFNPLSPEILRQISDKIVNDCVKKLKRKGYTIVCDENVADYIATGIDMSMGARPIKRNVNHLIMDAIIDRILDGRLNRNQPINICVQNNGLIFSNLE
jgi:ATP-dependent Clp protease ATP-binding subunit ClpB